MSDMQTNVKERFGAMWVSGEGPVALVAYCGGPWAWGPTVTLHKTVEAANAEADDLVCGSRCTSAHLVVTV